MELSLKDMKFLTIMNEARLSDGKLFGRYFEEVSKIFPFSNSELTSAVNKFLKLKLLSVIDVGGNEKVYFHTEKVLESHLDKSLRNLRY